MESHDSKGLAAWHSVVKKAGGTPPALARAFGETGGVGARPGSDREMAERTSGPMEAWGSPGVDLGFAWARPGACDSALCGQWFFVGCLHCNRLLRH